MTLYNKLYFIYQGKEQITGNLYTFDSRLIYPHMNNLRTTSQIIESSNAIEATGVQLVEKMLALQKERQSVRREDDLDRVRNLEREIVHVDEEIDRRVYFLYGLTEEEVRIIEG